MRNQHGHRPPLLRAGTLALWLGVAGLLGGTSGPAAADPPTYSAALPVAGKMQGDQESIVFSGMVVIETTVITAPQAPPIAEIAFDFSAVTARGEESGTAYRVDSPTGLQRRLNTAETIEVSFPYYPDGEPLSARSATASFKLYATGKTSKTMAVGTDRPERSN